MGMPRAWSCATLYQKSLPRCMTFSAGPTSATSVLMFCESTAQTSVAPPLNPRTLQTPHQCRLFTPADQSGLMSSWFVGATSPRGSTPSQSLQPDRAAQSSQVTMIPCALPIGQISAKVCTYHVAGTCPKLQENGHCAPCQFETLRLTRSRRPSLFSPGIGIILEVGGQDQTHYITRVLTESPAAQEGTIMVSAIPPLSACCPLLPLRVISLLHCRPAMRCGQSTVRRRRDSRPTVLRR